MCITWTRGAQVHRAYGVDNVGLLYNNIVYYESIHIIMLKHIYRHFVPLS